MYMLKEYEMFFRQLENIDKFRLRFDGGHQKFDQIEYKLFRLSFFLLLL